MTSVPPEEILSGLDRLRRQARAARHACWFPLVLFGLLTCASLPFYVSGRIAASPGVVTMTATAPPALLGGEQAGRNGLFLAWYWAFALVTGYLLSYAWYRRHQRLYDVENLLFRLGWNPGNGSWAARLVPLPNVLLPALVLLAAGTGAFLWRPRPGRA